MLPPKKPSLTPANQTVAMLLKPHMNNTTSQTPSNTTFPTFTPSKFFIEHFPSWLDYHDLKKTLAKIGPVTNLFVSRKKTSRGRKFGFVSFLSTLKESDICDNLNLIWFDSYKIHANLVRFQKPLDKKPDLVIKPQPKTMPKLTFRDTRTFVEALSVTKHPKKTVMYESIPDDKEWLQRSLVGFIATDVDYAYLEHMVLKNVKQTVGFRFLGASQAVITFTNRESMEKELVNGSSVLETSFFHLKPWEKGAKAIDRFVWVSKLGLPLIGWNRRCIESIIEKAGKMLGYDITSVSQGSLTGVKVLLSTTSFEMLNEHVLLVLDGDEFEISIMEMKPDFSPLLSTIKHSMGATDIILTQQQKADTDSDFSLILYQWYIGPTNNLDHTDTSSKIVCLFPETKETRDEGATDSDSNTDVSAHSVTRVGLVKNRITGQVKGTRLINKAINSCNSFSDFIRDLAEPQEVVEMELQEKKRKKLKRTRRLGPKYTYGKGKKGKKNRHALALNDTSDIVPDSFRNTSQKENGSPPAIKSSSDQYEDITSNHASIDTETSDTQAHLPTLLNSQCSQEASSEAINENNRNARSKSRKIKLLQASGSVANTTEKCVSSDSLNSGIKQGNVRFQTTCENNQVDGFDIDKETQEMLHDAAALGLGTFQDLIGYEEGVRGNIDREVDEWKSVNQLATVSLGLGGVL
ncbi:uncharacterized protein [Populus alba]|uniref:uncharacterized protein isoform X2 n=1 Tax=Populus alba TaxID=43335 RepID=UPI003CC74451